MTATKCEAAGSLRVSAILQLNAGVWHRRVTAPVLLWLFNMHFDRCEACWDRVIEEPPTAAKE